MNIHVNVISIEKQLSNAWWSDYSSFTLTYPFYYWVKIKFNARLNRFDNKFELVFEDQDSANQFIKDWNLDETKN